MENKTILIILGFITLPITIPLAILSVTMVFGILLIILTLLVDNPIIIIVAFIIYSIIYYNKRR